MRKIHSGSGKVCNLKMSVMPRELFEKYAVEYQTKIETTGMELRKLSATLQQKKTTKQQSLLIQNQLDADHDMYKSVGKMFVKEEYKDLNAELEKDLKVLDKDIEAMEKITAKLAGEYKDAQRNLDSLVKKVSGQ